MILLITLVIAIIMLAINKCAADADRKLRLFNEANKKIVFAEKLLAKIEAEK